MNIVETLPLSLEDLLDYYETTLNECEFIRDNLKDGLEFVEYVMKPRAVVSVRFNKYESYFKTLLEHLKWRVSSIALDEDLPISDSEARKKLIEEVDYELCGVSHPIGREEIEPLLESINDVIENLNILISEIEKLKLKSIFLCHSSEDKDFARKIAEDLIKRGAKVWIDEAEINIGDSLIKKIQEGIHNSDYLGALLSKNSIQSEWVQRELEIALNEEIEKNNVKVLPLMIEECEIPGFLSSKVYADFTESGSYNEEFNKLINKLKE
ncbi:toll/interleukin-1 receptor domain-containing protein [Halanaerobium sp. ST460_2HS_T2]|uniref:toll/interleukin-1 receptor domain-containing protein n=1 Tax=Halanaerobium sp. ST460_2HS_T2 TaxID=2183914 RepID=UPI000E009892|nr:toll/interleukin-1 receptor domain-containing protein [Halanaerobium sp. ST460_2HS_T2]RCW51597.1 TIR domain-containing protein [Halanaerobium sp. ST460_2HS_T2]